MDQPFTFTIAARRTRPFQAYPVRRTWATIGPSWPSSPGALIAASRRFVRARGEADDAPLPLLLRPAIVLFSGILAGAAAAVVSQPADVLLTRICASTSVANCALDAAGSFREQLAELARGGLREAYAGLGPRLAMVSAMTSVQFLLYDWVRCQLQCESTPPRAEG